MAAKGFTGPESAATGNRDSSVLGPKQRHLRHGYACLACEKGRKKCDGQRPCSRCARLGKDCVDGKAAARRREKAAATATGGSQKAASRRSSALSRVGKRRVGQDSPAGKGGESPPAATDPILAAETPAISVPIQMSGKDMMLGHSSGYGSAIRPLSGSTSRSATTSVPESLSEHCQRVTAVGMSLLETARRQQDFRDTSSAVVSLLPPAAGAGTESSSFGTPLGPVAQASQIPATIPIQTSSSSSSSSASCLPGSVPHVGVPDSGFTPRMGSDGTTSTTTRRSASYEHQAVRPAINAVADMLWGDVGNTVLGGDSATQAVARANVIMKWRKQQHMRDEMGARRGGPTRAWELQHSDESWSDVDAHSLDNGDDDDDDEVMERELAKIVRAQLPARRAIAAQLLASRLSEAVGPSAALRPKLGLLDAPLCSPQGIAAWTELFTRALSAGKMMHLEEGIKNLLASTPGASERLGVPMRVVTSSGRPVRAAILPPGHHPHHEVSSMGVAAGGLRDAASSADVPNALPTGFDDVVESALAGTPVPVCRMVYDDVVGFPISVYINQAGMQLFGTNGLDIITLINSGGEIHWIHPDTVVPRALAKIEAEARHLKSYRFRGKYLRFVRDGITLPVPTVHSCFFATEYVTVMYGPSGKVRSATSFFLDVRFTQKPLHPAYDLNVSKRIGTVLIRNPRHLREAVTAVSACKKAFDFRYANPSEVPDLPAWDNVVTKLNLGLRAAMEEDDDQFLRAALAKSGEGHHDPGNTVAPAHVPAPYDPSTMPYSSAASSSSSSASSYGTRIAPRYDSDTVETALRSVAALHSTSLLSHGPQEAARAAKAASDSLGLPQVVFTDQEVQIELMSAITADSDETCRSKRRRQAVAGVSPDPCAHPDPGHISSSSTGSNHIESAPDAELSTDQKAADSASSCRGRSLPVRFNRPSGDDSDGERLSIASSKPATTTMTCGGGAYGELVDDEGGEEKLAVGIFPRLTTTEEFMERRALCPPAIALAVHQATASRQPGASSDGHEPSKSMPFVDAFTAAALSAGSSASASSASCASSSSSSSAAMAGSAPMAAAELPDTGSTAGSPHLSGVVHEVQEWLKSDSPGTTDTHVSGKTRSPSTSSQQSRSQSGGATSPYMSASDREVSSGGMGPVRPTSMTMAALPDSLPAGKVAVIRPRNEIDQRFLPAFEQALPNPQGVRVRFSWPTGLFGLAKATGPYGSLRVHEAQVRAVEQRAAAKAEAKRVRISSRNTRKAQDGIVVDDADEDDDIEQMPARPWFLDQKATEVKPTWAAVSSLDPMMPIAGLLGLAMRAPELETASSDQPGQVIAASSQPAFAGAGCTATAMHKLARLHKASRDAQRWKSGLQAVSGSEVEELDTQGTDLSQLGSSFAEDDDDDDDDDDISSRLHAGLATPASGFAPALLSRASIGPASRLRAASSSAGLRRATSVPVSTIGDGVGVLDRLRSIDQVHMDEDDDDVLSEGMSRLSLSSPVPEDDWRTLGQIEEQDYEFGGAHRPAAQGIRLSAALLTPELDEIGMGLASGLLDHPPPNLV